MGEWDLIGDIGPCFACISDALPGHLKAFS